MAVKLEAIRAAATRVAASHGLDLVEIEFIGPAKERILRVFLEKNAEGRAKLKAAIEAGSGGDGTGNLPERLIQETEAGKLRVEQLSGVTHGSRRRVHAGGQFSGAGPQVDKTRGFSTVCGLPGQGSDLRACAQ
jgi:hypothetical protein